MVIIILASSTNCGGPSPSIGIGNAQKELIVVEGKLNAKSC